MQEFYCEYITAGADKLFTAVCLPKQNQKFPTVIIRSPYVDKFVDISEEETVAEIAENNKNLLEDGYAVVYQHCRGRGKSTGDFVPFLYEREDGLSLQEWIRKQPFYNGEIFLFGESYTASVHYATLPFAPDIKGAVFKVQDPVRYNAAYRNGFYKIGLSGNWYVQQYKRKSDIERNYVPETFNMLPLTRFSKTVFGEESKDLNETLMSPNTTDEIWESAKWISEELSKCEIPMLFVTGFYDIYTGGVFDAWNSLNDATKKSSALLVHPYNHGENSASEPIEFTDASTKEVFGDYVAKWFNFVRGKEAAPVKQGEVTYYKLFGSAWCTDEFKQPSKTKEFALGKGEKTYLYNPYAPATFKGGLSANFGGNEWQDEPNSRHDILSFFSEEFTEETFIKGKMKVKLRVKSDCEDTCFYVRLSLQKEEGFYGLRDDINKISNFDKNYVPNTPIDMEFSFDEHAFVAKKGERIRVDISSSAFPLYVRHTNNKGPFYEQTNIKIARNTVFLDDSTVTLYTE